MFARSIYPPALLLATGLACLVSTGVQAQAVRYQYQKAVPALKVTVGSAAESGGLPTTPAQPPTLTLASISVSSDRMTFGPVAVGQSLTNSVLVTNVGGQLFTFSTAPTISGANFSAVSNCGSTLEVGGSCQLDVTFTPAILGPASGELNILGNAANSPVVVPLQGVGSQAEGTLTPSTGSSADFGVVSPGETSERTYVFTNIGDAYATRVAAAVPEGKALTLLSNGCGTAAAPVTLAAGGSCLVTVAYSPIKEETLSGGVLAVTSSAINSPSTIALSGSASYKDPHWSNVVMLMHFDGANQSQVFVDEKGTPITVYGQATKIYSTSAKFGSGGLGLPGSGGSLSGTLATSSRLTFPGANFAFGTGDFTVEYWWRQGSTVSWDEMFATGMSGNSFSLESDKNYGLTVRTYSNGAVAYNYQGNTNNLPVGVWQHIAVTRKAGILRVFINGTLRTSVANSTNWTADATASIGAFPNGSYDVVGDMDELRVTKGIARYTTNFTVPTSAFPNQ